MLGELLALTNWEKTRNKIIAIRRENPPGARGFHRCVSDSTSSYNSESRRASSVEFPNRADS